MTGLLDQHGNPITSTLDQLAARLDLAGGGTSAAGEVVSVTRALQVSTVFACIESIASGCAVPTLDVFTDDEAGRPKIAKDAPQRRVLHRRPNEWQTSLEWRRTMTAHAALTGNGFSVPTYVDGVLKEMIPVLPDQVHIEDIGRYQRIYRVHDEWGEIGVFDASAIFHLPGLMWNGKEGMDALRVAREAVGLSRAIERGQSREQMNGGRPSGIIYTDQTLDTTNGPKVIERIKEGWHNVSSGADRGKVGVLDWGFRFQPLSFSAVDAQLLETRRFQVEEICRAFGVFPQMVMHTDKASTFASAEAFFAAHERQTIRKWQQIWVQRLDEFALDGAGPLYAKFDNREIDAATLKDRGEYFARMTGAGGTAQIMTVNEIRIEMGLPPMPGGDVLHPPTGAAKKEPKDE